MPVFSWLGFTNASTKSSSNSVWSCEKMVAMDVNTLQVFIMFSSVRKCEAMAFSMDFPLIN